MTTGGACSRHWEQCSSVAKRAVGLPALESRVCPCPPVGHGPQPNPLEPPPPSISWANSRAPPHGYDKAQALAIVGARRNCGAPGPLLRTGSPSQGQGHPSSLLQRGCPQPASQLPFSVPTLESPGGRPRHPQPHSCPSCLQNHVNLVHRKGKTKVCPHPGCGKKFYLSNHLRRHMIIHSGQAQDGAGSTGRRAMGVGSRAGAGWLKPQRALGPQA